MGSAFCAHLAQRPGVVFLILDMPCLEPFDSGRFRGTARPHTSLHRGNMKFVPLFICPVRVVPVVGGDMLHRACPFVVLVEGIVFADLAYALETLGEVSSSCFLCSSNSSRRLISAPFEAALGSRAW